MSDNKDFYARYLDSGRDDDAGEAREEDDTGVGGVNGHNSADDEQSTSSQQRGSDVESTAIVERAQFDAELRRIPPPGPRQPPGAGPSQPGIAAPGQPPSAPPPDHYWGGGGGRHGYDPEPPQPPRESSTGPGSVPQSHPAPPAPGIGEPDRGDPSAAGRRGAEGPAPHDSGPWRVAPRNQVGPYPQAPSPAGPGTPRVGRAPYPPAPQRGYDEGAPPPERSRRAPMPPDDPRGVSVGDLRAQIRESQVAPPYKPVPQTGWRKGLHRTTRINVGLSADEKHWNDLRRRLTVNLRGKYVIAVMGAKGGVNKTTAAVCIGAALSRYRTDKIVAIDANPASGNLSERIDEPVTMSWRGLINDPNVREYTDFRHYLGKHSSSGLEVLGSDPGDEELSGNDLWQAWNRLQVLYPIAILDCGNQLRDELTRTMLDRIRIDAIVVPSTTRLDGAKGAAETLNWLATHGYPHLVREAVVIVSNINKIDASQSVRRLHEDFERTVRAVHEVPFDQHLSDAVAIDFERLRPATRKSYIEAAASLVDGFAGAADREASGHRWGGQE